MAVFVVQFLVGSSTAVTRNPEMAEVIASAATQLTVACWFPRVAVTPVGAAGIAVGIGSGMTGYDIVERSPVPTPLVAVTWKR